MNFSRFWIQPDAGDPLPAIGSGFRLVLAQVGTKWVKVKPVAAKNAEASRIPLSRWEQIPKLAVEPGESPRGRALTTGSVTSRGNNGGRKRKQT